jgi:protein MPE1
MSSTILYKFRSGTTFEALPLPGSVARLFDVKKAIVQAKKLDQGSMDFDLSVRNATTNEEYTDESMMLPRGTRVVVQRLPAAKGHGFLARMARNQYGGGGMPGQQAGMPLPGQPASGYYTIDSRAQDDDEEFVSTTNNNTTTNMANASLNEEKELAALRAATEAASSSAAVGASRGMRPAPAGGFRSGGPAGSGPPTAGPPRQGGGGQGGGGGGGGGNFQARQRPNADPELRDQEKKDQPKKRATGIPRTFLNLSAPPAVDGSAEGEGNSMPMIQPNTIGFVELVNRGGGQSGNALSSKKNLDYALKVTATIVPEYLQCPICDGVVRDALILPWDPEMRTTCGTCIRDALTQNGFRCPLTGMEGVSPDDLLPNHALRKAGEQFIRGVMEKMEEIEKQQVDDDTGDNGADDMGGDKRLGSVLKGDSADKGVVLSRRAILADKKKQEEEDPFGGGDDDPFGGDVFAVEVEEPKEEEEVGQGAGTVESSNKTLDTPAQENKSEPEKDKVKEPVGQKDAKAAPVPVPVESTEPQIQHTRDRAANKSRQDPSSLSPRSTSDPHNHSGGRRETNVRRGPPVGYTMGPAGGAAGGPRGGPANEGYSNGRGGQDSFDDSQSDRSYRGRGRGDRGGRHTSGGYGGRQGGRGDRGRGSRGSGRGEDEYASNDRNSPADGPTHDDVSACFRSRMSTFLVCDRRIVIAIFVALRSFVASLKLVRVFAFGGFFPQALFELVYALECPKQILILERIRLNSRFIVTFWMGHS